MLTRTQRKPKKTEERWETCFSYHEADAYLYAFKESRSKTSSKEGGRQVVRTRRVLEWRTGEVTGNLCVGLELEKFLAGGRREWPDIHTKRRRSRGSKCASWATTNEVKEGMKILRARGSFIVGRHRKDVIARSPPVVPGLTPRGFGDGPAEWRVHIGTRADRSSGGSKRGLVITVVADIVPAMWNIGSWARDGLGISRTVSGRNRNKLRRRLKVQGRCRHAQELFSRRTGSRWLEGGGRRKIKEWILCLWGFERWQGSLAFLAVRRKRITELGEFQSIYSSDIKHTSILRSWDAQWFFCQWFLQNWAMEGAVAVAEDSFAVVSAGAWALVWKGRAALGCGWAVQWASGALKDVCDGL